MASCRLSSKISQRYPILLASIAKQKQILINVFSDALGHDSEKTTLIYLSTLDTSAVDNANSDILAALVER